MKLAHMAPAFLVLALLAGCAAVPPAKQTGMSFSGYMTKVVVKGNYLRYSISSLLAGPRAEMSCVPEQMQHNAIALVDCVGLSAGERALMAGQFTAASASYQGFSKGIGIARNRVVLVPSGVGYSEVASFVEKPEHLSMAVSVRYDRGSEALRRNAVRVYVHELLHLNRAAAGWKISRAREEYLASLMESCVEMEVFGDTRGYALEGDIAATGIEGLSRSQRRSADMFSAAYLDIRSFIGEAGSLSRGQGYFDGFCRMTFNSLE
ncbi:hypothetical protein [Pseudoxanthomonas gei]|nr:hypothetical protein [Pseudoxanthomonas gei]